LPEIHLKQIPENNQHDQFALCLTGLAIYECYDINGGSEPFNYSEAYAALNDAIKSASKIKYKTALPKEIKDRAKLVKSVFDKNTFSDRWLGAGNKAVSSEAMDAVQTYDSLVYSGNANDFGFVELSKIKAVLGADIDVWNDDEWCIDATGNNVIKADDYYTGNYAEFLENIESDIASAADEIVKLKLLKQRELAKQKIEVPDVTRLKFTTTSPFISYEQKLLFLRENVDQRFYLEIGDDGRPKFKYDISSNRTEKEWTHSRYADYLNSGSLGTRTSKEKIAEDPALEAEKLARLRELRNSIDTRLNIWVKTDRRAFNAIKENLENPKRIFFKRIEDTAPIKIEGWNDLPLEQGGVPLHSYQNAELRTQTKKFGGILGFGTGLGKAQPLTSKVLTPDGWKLMGDLKIGDDVFAYDGSVVKVTGVFPQGKKEIYECTFSDGSKTKCCKEHLWFTETKKDRRNNKHDGGDNCSVTIDRGSVKSLNDIKSTLISGTRKNHKIPMVMPIDFNEKDVLINPYLLGVLLGDGNFTHKTVTFTNSEKQVSDEINTIIENEYSSNVSLMKRVFDEKHACTFGISRLSNKHENVITTALKHYGLMGCGSDEKFIPSDYLFSSFDQRLLLLRGLMDTDGYVSKDGITVQFYSTSIMLADGIIDLVRSFGGIAWKKEKLPTFKYKGEMMEGKPCYIVSIRMPSSINPFFLERKACKVKPKTKYLPTRYFVDVQSVGFEEAQCISIDHHSHLYITDDYIVTHNTFTALATVQYIQSIGIKKKTVFVVPNNVLTNWRREAMRGYKNMDDCLFVGLDIKKNGELTVDSSNYRRDMEIILQNRHKKIFMTLNAFTAIPVRDETVSAYSAFITNNDPTYAIKLNPDGGVKQADVDKNDAKKEKTKDFGKKDESYPFFEDMGIDSIVMDEAHMAKNSKFVVDFKGAAYLSTAPASNRGLDIQLKSWYVRGLSSRGDGVLCLSATPITNSPLEIYGMLSIAIGEKELNNRLGIFGADQFMDAFSAIEFSDEEDIIGNIRNIRTFTGIQNVNLLRTALSQVANIKDAEDVGNDIAVPEHEESITTVQMDGRNIKLLSDYKRAYSIAKSVTKNQPIFPEELEWYEEFKEKEGVHSDKLLAHPFNVISKMTDVILDDEIDSGFSRYNFNVGQLESVKKAVKAFNDKAFKDDVINLGKTYSAEDIISEKVKSVETDDGKGIETHIFTVKIRANIAGNAIVLNSVSFDKQSKLIAILEKNKIDIDVNVSPKLASMIANFKLEQANPKSGITSKQAKQIIFCDSLSAHNKIRILLNKQCGIPLSKISIVNAVAAPDAADMQDVQDGFNGEDDENKYSVIIANKKAEVGINLQNYTQAIHHLTIGWTPDSQTQRNGRAVRQGNKLGMVKIYHYNTDGTFDDYKRMLVNKKDQWITSVMKGDTDTVTIEGGMSNQDMEDMIDATGDKDAIKKIAERITAKENMARIKSVRSSQTENARIVESQQKWLEKYPSVAAFASEKIDQLKLLRQQKENILLKLSRSKNEAVIKKLQGMIDDADSKYNELDSYIKRSSTNGRIEISSEIGADFIAHKQSVQESINIAKADFERFSNDVGGAYSASMLDAISSKTAVILNGKIISEGMIGISNGKFYVAGVKNNSATGYSKKVALIDPSNGDVKAIERGANFDWYCENDATWPIVAENVAAIDDATINERGDYIKTGSDSLFSTFNSDIARRVKSVLKTNEMRLRDIELKTPYFQYVISPITSNPTALQKDIIDNQASVLFFDESKENARINSIFSNGYATNNKVEKFTALMLWAKSKNITLTIEDAGAFALTDYRSNFDESYFFDAMDICYPDLKAAFKTILNDVVKTAKSASDIDSSVFIYFNTAFPLIYINQGNIDEYLENNGLLDDIKSAKQSLALGGRPVLLVDVLMKSNAVKMAVVDYVNLLAEKDIANIDIEYPHVIDFLQNYSGELFIESDIEGFYRVNNDLSKAMIYAYELEKPIGALILSDKKDGDASIVFSTLGNMPYARSAMEEFTGKIKEYRLAQKQMEGGFNIEEIKTLDGVQTVEVGSKDISATLYNPGDKKYNSKYLFKAGNYIAIGFKYGSDINTKVMDRDTGLAGRFFDNDKHGSGTKKWLLAISNEETTSAGTKIASVKDLVDFVIKK